MKQGYIHLEAPILLVAVVLVKLVFSLLLGLVLVNGVQTLGLDQLVNNTASKASHDLLGMSVINGLAILLAVLVVGFGSLVRSSSGDKLVGEGALVLTRLNLLVRFLEVIKKAPTDAVLV